MMMMPTLMMMTRMMMRGRERVQGRERMGEDGRMGGWEDAPQTTRQAGQLVRRLEQRVAQTLFLRCSAVQDCAV